MVKKLIVAAGVVVVLLVGVGVWYFVINDDTVEKTTAECEGGCEESTVDSVDGAWTIDPAESDGTIVIKETIGGVADHEAEGNTGELTGDLTVEGGQVTAADITVDMSALEFTDSPSVGSAGNRANAMKTQGLQTDDFPEATFSLTEPIDLGDDPAGTTAAATGDLTIHGVTNPVTFDVDIVADGDTFRITPTEFIPVVLEDYDMSVSAPGFVADIDDQGTFDFLLVISQS